MADQFLKLEDSFHHSWIAKLANALNLEVLPGDYFALIELANPRKAPDCLSLDLKGDDLPLFADRRLAIAQTPPKAQLITSSEAGLYLDKVDRITVRHRHGEVVAVIELVSPGNKHSKAALRAFVEKAADFLQSGVHRLVVDLFPPTSRDPLGIHKAIWDEFEEVDYELPLDKQLTLASYEAGPVKSAYVDFVAVGDNLLDKPLFLRNDTYVMVPLEKTYQATWKVFPTAVKQLLVE